MDILNDTNFSEDDINIQRTIHHLTDEDDIMEKNIAVKSKRSICPECKGEGKVSVHKQDIRCWSCNGNGNDTAEDFYKPRDYMRESGKWKC